MTAATAAGRHGCLLEVNLPDRKPFVNPLGTPRAGARGGRGGGSFPVLQPRENCCGWRDRRKALDAGTMRAPPASTTARASTRVRQGVVRRPLTAALTGEPPTPRSAARPSTAGGTVASGAGIKPGEALPREALYAADVPLDCPAASCPGRRGPMGCFGIEKHYRSQSGVMGESARIYVHSTIELGATMENIPMKSLELMRGLPFISVITSPF
jgi:hypothetical protein